MHRIRMTGFVLDHLIVVTHARSKSVRKEDTLW